MDSEDCAKEVLPEVLTENSNDGEAGPRRCPRIVKNIILLTFQWQ